MYIRLFLISLFFLTCLPIYAQTDLPADSSGMVYAIAEQPPKFVGGLDKWRSYCIKRLYPYPAYVMQGYQVTVLVKCVADTDGSLSNFQIEKKNERCPECDTKALNVVQNSPKWLPAIHKGHHVKAVHVIKVVYELH